MVRRAANLKRDLQRGDYVLATKYSDGDPHDHFVVGFIGDRLDYATGVRYQVVDGNGQQFRHNGFRRCERISAETGKTIVEHMKFIEMGAKNVWWWKRHLAILRNMPTE